MKWRASLEIWRTQRNIQLTNDFYDMITEEIKEFNDAENINEIIDALCDIIVFTENQLVLENLHINYTKRISHTMTQQEVSNYLITTLEAYCVGASNNQNIFQSLYSVAASYIEQLGYSVSLVMKETLKEIQSRRQNPLQKKEWEENGPKGKWLKDKMQDETTLYKAKYNLCKSKPI